MVSERTPQDVLREHAAWALAATRITKDHGQLCPVWTQRMKRSEKPWQEAIAGCNCWIIKEARTTVRILEERGWRLDKAIAEAPDSPPDDDGSGEQHPGFAPKNVPQGVFADVEDEPLPDDFGGYRNPSTCRHRIITAFTFSDTGEAAPVWACAECRLRFDPRHIEAPDGPTRAMYSRLAAEHETEPTVPDHGGGVSGDRDPSATPDTLSEKPGLDVAERIANFLPVPPQVSGNENRELGWAMARTQLIAAIRARPRLGSTDSEGR